MYQGIIHRIFTKFFLSLQEHLPLEMLFGRVDNVTMFFIQCFLLGIYNVFYPYFRLSVFYIFSYEVLFLLNKEHRIKIFCRKKTINNKKQKNLY